MLPNVKQTFGNGMDNTSHETAVPNGTARRVVNMDVTNTGTLATREGVSKLIDDLDAHSLFSCKSGAFYCGSGTLKRINDDYSTTDLLDGLDLNLPIAYCEVNGTVYWANGQVQGKIIDGQNLPWSPGRNGTKLAYYNGRIYIGYKNALFPTDALDYEHVDPFRNFILLPSDLTMLAASSGGLFVGTHLGVFFLGGPDYKQFSFAHVDRARPAPGSEFCLEGRLLGLGGTCCVWMAPYGWALGTPDGGVAPLNGKALALPDFDSAVTAYYETNGMAQLIAMTRGGAGVSTAAAIDSVTTEVIRGGRLVA